MRLAVESDLLWALMNSTPEQHCAVRRVLGLPELSLHDPGNFMLQKINYVNKTADIVSQIHQEIKTIREERRELRSAKERLEQMQAGKLFAFTNKIDVESFRVLCAVLAQGDVAKASRALNTHENTVRSRVKGWEDRGPAYRVLIDLVRWRKAMGNRGTVALNESITGATAASADFAGLLSDVLDELLAMTEENWNEKVEVLADLLRPHVER